MINTTQNTCLHFYRTWNTRKYS